MILKKNKQFACSKWCRTHSRMPGGAVGGGGGGGGGGGNICDADLSGNAEAEDERREDVPCLGK